MEDIYEENEKISQKWETIFDKDIADKAAVYNTYKKFLKLNDKTNFIMNKGTDRHFTKDNIQMANKHKKTTSYVNSICQ